MVCTLASAMECVRNTYGDVYEDARAVLEECTEGDLALWGTDVCDCLVRDVYAYDCMGIADVLPRVYSRMSEDTETWLLRRIAEGSVEDMEEVFVAPSVPERLKERIASLFLAQTDVTHDDVVQFLLAGGGRFLTIGQTLLAVERIGVRADVRA